MIADLLLLGAYAASTKIKSNRLKANAAAVEKQKNAVTNFGFSKSKGIFPMPSGYKLKSDETHHGFMFQGKFTKSEVLDKSRTDIYAHPYIEGKTITQEGYNKYLQDKNIPDIKSKPLVKLVAQRGPNNELFEIDDNFFNQTKEKKATKKTKVVSGYYDNNNNFKTDGKKPATHNQLLTEDTDGNIEVTLPELLKKPEKTKVADLIEEEQLLDKDNNPTTNPKEALFVQTFKTVNNKKVIIKTEPFKQGDPVPKTIFFSSTKDGKIGIRLDSQVNADFYQKVRVFPDGREEAVEPPVAIDLAKTIPESQAKIMFDIEFMEDGKVKAASVTQKEYIERKNKGQEIRLVGRQRFNEKGEPQAYEPYTATGSKKAVETAMESENVSSSYLFDTGEKLSGNFKNKFVGTSFSTNKMGVENLTKVDAFLAKNPFVIAQINNDPTKLQGFQTEILNNLETYFEPPIKQGERIFAPNKPASPQDASDKVAQNFKQLAKIKGVLGMNGIAAQASDMVSARMVEQFKTNNLKKPNEDGLVIQLKVEQNGEKGTVFFNAPYNKKYNKIMPRIMEAISNAHVGGAENIQKLASSLIRYEVDEVTGLPIEEDQGDGTFRLVPAKVQPELDFIMQLESSQIPNLTVQGRPATLFDAFINIVSPFPDQAPLSGSLNPNVEKLVKRKIALLTRANFKKTSNLIEQFVDATGETTENLINGTYGDSLNSQKVQMDLEGKETSSYNGITTIDSILGTYEVMVDGQKRFIDINSVQGKIITTLAGGAKVLNKGFNFLTGGKSFVDLATADIDEINSSLVNQSTVYDMENPDDEKERAARKANEEEFNNIKRLMSGDYEAFTAFSKYMPESLRRQFENKQVTKEILRKLAIRQYHKYMLAYQLAAAIQGGTGGRTISDQDVQNILTALNFGTFTDARYEVATLKEARNMLVQIYDYNSALRQSTQPNKQFAALKARQILMTNLNDQSGGVMLSYNIENPKLTVGMRRDFIMNKLKNVPFDYRGTAKKTTGKVSKSAAQKQKRLLEFINQPKN